MEDTRKLTGDARARGIAIVGMAGRFPGAMTVGEFWANLAGGVESIKLSTEEELVVAGVDAAMVANRNYVRAAGQVRDPDFFDAAFFGYSVRDAEIIDPQQRVFLECAWEALEDAACDPDAFHGSIAVFAGAGMNTYAVNNICSRPDVMESAGMYQVMVGNDKDFLSTRVAYKLNLRGPAIGVQTACSTSLVAVQMAFESLLRGECDMALAGGVSIPVPHYPGYMYVSGMILSRDGHCRAFDADASGTVPSAGAGIVVLKRLDDAMADGDHIYAVIHGAAINNDGSAKVGYSAPSVEGQTAVITRSMEMAGFDPESIGYVEAHGTGTEVGDPIEFTALASVFASAAQSKGSCVLGALKTNIGHLDTASGVAGLIKAALAIKHRAIPPTLHFSKANPLIDFKATAFHVNTSLLPFEAGRPMRAGVSSFGIGGTNAHVSLAEAPVRESGAPSGSQLIVLSAKSAPALEERLAQLEGYLDESAAPSLADVAFTLQAGRKPFRHRQAIVADTVEELKALLQSRSSVTNKLKSMRAESASSEAATVAFLFPGQGSQYVAMGRGLYDSEAVFRNAVDRCCEVLKSHLGLDLRTVLYPEEGGEGEAIRLLSRTAMTQPALFVIEYAMAQLWMSCGVRPAAMLGHSVGEYVAACLAGVFSLKDALMLIAERGRLIQSLPAGAMLAVSLAEQDLEPLLSGEVSIAAINSPGQTVASGSEAAIAALEAALQKRKITCRRLRTSHAFHSPMMEPILAEFVRCVAKIELRRPSIPYLSNVTGTWIAAEQAIDPAYWGSHLRSTVRFAECAAELGRDGDQVLLEVGPGDTLSTLVRGKHAAHDRRLVASMRHALAVENDREVWLTASGRLWTWDVRLNWKGFHAGQRRLKLSLPTYPFQRQRYYIEPGEPAAVPADSAVLRKAEIEDWFYAPSWRRAVADVLTPRELGVRCTWLLFAEDGPLTEALVAGMRRYDNTIQVKTGSGFRRLSDMQYEIDPTSPSDYEKLLQDLTARAMWPERIAHAWMVSAAEDWSLPSSVDRGVYSALALMQAVQESGLGRRVELNVICDRAYSVSGEMISSPAAGALNAFCTVVPVECPNVTTRVIDVDLQTNAVRSREQVVQELLSAAADETVAYRGNARWVQTWEPVRLAAPTIRTNRGIALREGGTYLITGGMGGIGLVLGRHLAKQARARVILISRSALPPAPEWPALLEDADVDERIKEKIAGIRAIQESGGEAILMAGDVADRAAMSRVVEFVKARYGAIHGIVHAAGIAGASMMVTMSRDQMLATLAAKVQGTEWIRECVGADGLDFVMLCSSISAVVPGFGLSAYAAANAYLDGFAAACDDSVGTRVLSVNWDTWREVGMAANGPVEESLVALREERTRHGLSSREAAEVFDRVLAAPLSQALVSTRSFDGLMGLVKQGISDVRIQASAMVLNKAANLEARDATDGSDDELERFIMELWRELLGVEQVGPNDNFFHLGGHSLLGTQVLARLQERFGVNLTLRTIFESATPEHLAQSVRLASWASSVESMEPSLEREEIEL